MARRKTTRKTKKKKRKSSSGSIFKNVNWKPILTIAVYVLLIGGVGYGLWYFFMNAEFFQIREISVTNDKGQPFEDGEKKLKRLYMGKNIFGVDLDRVGRVMKNSYSQIKKVDARRLMPDKLEVDIISRAPAAVIDTAGGIVIDREGVVLAVGTDDKELVKIKGMNFFLQMPSRGEQIENPALGNALLLVDALRKKMRRELDDVEYIDISDKGNMMIGVRGTKVKMGSDDFSGKIGTLREMLNDPNIDMQDIKYIDLRFEDPVISLK